MSEATSETSKTKPPIGRRAAGRAKPRAARPPAPTRPIEPGTIHFQIAQGLLEAAQKRANLAGVSLDVGEFPSNNETVNESDPQKIVNVTAHAVARVGDRFGFLRKFSRHAEGQEKRAGLLSDLVQALLALYERNPDLVREALTGFAQEMKQRKMQSEMMHKQTSTQAQNGVTTP